MFIRLVCQNENSNKFYQMRVEGTSLITEYGRIGQMPVVSQKTHSTKTDARNAYQKKLKEKLAKGYREDANVSAVLEEGETIFIEIKSQKGCSAILAAAGATVRRHAALRNDVRCRTRAEPQTGTIHVSYKGQEMTVKPGSKSRITHNWGSAIVGFLYALAASTAAIEIRLIRSVNGMEIDAVPADAAMFQEDIAREKGKVVAQSLLEEIPKPSPNEACLLI
jgi:predicted DNA-binding WGR domain protein